MSDAILSPYFDSNSLGLRWNEKFSRVNSSSKAVIYSSTTDGSIIENCAFLYFIITITEQIPNGQYLTMFNKHISEYSSTAYGPCEIISPILTMHVKVPNKLITFSIPGSSSTMVFTSTYDYLKIRNNASISDTYIATATNGSIIATCYGIELF